MVYCAHYYAPAWKKVGLGGEDVAGGHVRINKEAGMVRGRCQICFGEGIDWESNFSKRLIVEVCRELF